MNKIFRERWAKMAVILKIKYIQNISYCFQDYFLSNICVALDTKRFIIIFYSPVKTISAILNYLTEETVHT